MHLMNMYLRSLGPIYLNIFSDLDLHNYMEMWNAYSMRLIKNNFKCPRGQYITFALHKIISDDFEKWTSRSLNGQTDLDIHNIT